MVGDWPRAGALRVNSARLISQYFSALMSTYAHLDHPVYPTAMAHNKINRNSLMIT